LSLLRPSIHHRGETFDAHAKLRGNQLRIRVLMRADRLW
jgi:hypothetical protein